MRSSFNLVILILAAACSIPACRVDYFLHPLPVDSRNRTCAPPSLRGKYLMDVDSDQDTILILRNSLVYMRPQDTINYRIPYTLNYDSVRNQYDTSFRFKIFGDLLYTVDPQAPLLLEHWPYTRIEDTFQVIRNDSVIIDLGRNSFFRKVKRHTYILNYHTRLADDEGNWWHPILFRWNKKGIELFTMLPEDADSLKLHFYNHSSSYYYNLQWTAKQIDSMMKKGALKPDGYLKRLR